MGLLVLSVAISLLAGCLVWLAIGDRLPFGRVDKWPVRENILIYALIVLIPLYLIMFMLG